MTGGHLPGQRTFRHD